MLNSFTIDDIGQLPGARVDGTIPITDELANGVLQEMVVARQPKLRELSIAFQDNNRISVRCRIDAWWSPAINADLLLDRTVGNLSSPKITVRPASLLARAVLPFVERIGQLWTQAPSFLSVENGRISLHLLGIPEVAQYGAVLQHLKALNLITGRGKLTVNFAMVVDYNS